MNILSHISIKFLSLTLGFFLLGNPVSANVDSLLRALNHTEGKERIDNLNQLSIYYREQRDYEKAVRYAKESLALINKISETSTKAVPLNTMALNFYAAEDYESSINMAGQALKNALKYGLKEEEAYAYHILGASHFKRSEYNKAKQYWEKSQELYTALKNNKKLADIYMSLGAVHKNWAEYSQAIEYYQKALKIHEALFDTLNIAKSLSNIGTVYFAFGIDYEKALDYYTEARNMFVSKNVSILAAHTSNSIGLVYIEKGEYDKAEENFKNSLKTFSVLNNKDGTATTFAYLGIIQWRKKQYTAALNSFNKAQSIFKELGQQKNYILNFTDIARVYRDMGRYNEAIRYYQRFIEQAQDINLKRELIDQYQELANTYEEIGNYKQALHYYQKYASLKDTVLSEDYLNQINEYEAKYENEKKKRELALKDSELKEQEAENKRKDILIYSFILILLLITIFSFLLFRQFRIIKQNNQLLNEQNEEITAQRDHIFKQNKEITDSINYASIIQSAILPPLEILKQQFPEHFVFYKPRDIVSGDFYWIYQREKMVLIAVADCTGHGVPGAFMSMLGMAFLNDIAKTADLKRPDIILTDLRDRVINSLHQGGHGEAKDGMDIAVCVIDKTAMKLYYAGALNPVFIIRDKELYALDADRMPIGYYTEKPGKFTHKTQAVETGDNIYLFSDGYQDQFGGPRKKKFMARRFKELLVEINQMPMAEQKDKLGQILQDWMVGQEQIDDITVLGFRV